MEVLAFELQESAAAELWGSLLALRDYLEAHTHDCAERVAVFHRAGDSWRFTPLDALGPDDGSERLVVPLDGRAAEDAKAAAWVGSGRVSFFLHDRFLAGKCPFVHPTGRRLTRRVLTFYRIYLPVLLGGYRAAAAERPFVIAHLAQSLDGRIACSSGHSQWISNQANLHHAHRLRALNDAVMVGRRTVESDDPLLTVRHTAGRDPVRIVLNGSGSLSESVHPYRVLTGAGCMLVCRQGAAAVATDSARSTPVEVVAIAANGDARLAPDAVGRALRARGFSSIFLEGGAATVSSFFEQGLVDVLHVHIAPMILGSGVSSFALPEVATVQQGHALCMEHFAVDGELLLECRAAAAARPAPPASLDPGGAEAAG